MWNASIFASIFAPMKVGGWSHKCYLTNVTPNWKALHKLRFHQCHRNVFSTECRHRKAVTQQTQEQQSTRAAIYSISPVGQEVQGNTVSLLKTSSCLNHHKQAAAQGSKCICSRRGLHHHVQKMPTTAPKVMGFRNWNLLVQPQHTNAVSSLLVL